MALDYEALAEIFAEAALEASIPVMSIYRGGRRTRRKSDGSPVTDADEAAEALILKRLAERLPEVPVVAEEAASEGKTARPGPLFLLVDPVDGTLEFLSGNGEFTINIALIADGVPRAGAVYAPALGKLWIGAASASVCTVQPGGALPGRSERKPITARPAPKGGLIALASRSHPSAAAESFLGRLPVIERREAGSSLKFCLIAEGIADVYPRFGPTMEWDTAAGDAILRAAGGIVTDERGEPLRYGKVDVKFANGPFIAWGDPEAVRVALAQTA